MALNFMRSAKPPMTSAVVIAAKIRAAAIYLKFFADGLYFSESKGNLPRIVGVRTP